VNLNEIQDSVTQWAHDRNLIEGTTSDKQFVKLIEEAGEVAECIAKDMPNLLMAEIGDMLVVLNNICVQNDTTLNECFEMAWNKIKYRRGKMIDGYYVKEDDLTS